MTANRDNAFMMKLAKLPVRSDSYDAELVNGKIVSRVHVNREEFLCC